MRGVPRACRIVRDFEAVDAIVLGLLDEDVDVAVVALDLKALLDEALRRRRCPPAGLNVAVAVRAVVCRVLIHRQSI